MTGPWEVRRRQGTTFVLALARAIEERLRAAAGVREEVVRYVFRAAREMGDALVAVDSHGRIVAVNEAAARWSVVDGGVLAPPARDAVVKALCAPAARHDGEVRLESAGVSATVSPVRYEGARIGAILRISPPAGRARAATADRAAARYDFRCILGSSPRLRPAVELAMTAARNNLPVVLSGESGTGKELFAQAIHSGGARRDRRFVAVSCGSIPARAPRGGAVRVRARHVHRRATGGESRTVRGGRRRHAVPGRGDGAGARRADGAPARPPGEGGRAARRERAAPGGRPHPGGDEQATRGGDALGSVPQRSVLPPERPLDLRAGVARSRRGRRPAGAGVRSGDRRRAARAHALARCARGDADLPVARERPGAEERASSAPPRSRRGRRSPRPTSSSGRPMRRSASSRPMPCRRPAPSWSGSSSCRRSTRARGTSGAPRISSASRG